jgi:hypothetical protein
MMNVEEARKRELARSLVESAKQIEANRQRQRREKEDAQREREEAEMLQAQRERLRRLDIEQEAWRRVQEEWNKQEQIENTNKIFREKLNAAEAILQQKRIQYLFSRNTAPAELDSQMDNSAKCWAGELAKVKDPETHEKLSSNTGPFLQLMREKFKKNIEEKLKKQASECFVPYVSPF